MTNGGRFVGVLAVALPAVDYDMFTSNLRSACSFVSHNYYYCIFTEMLIDVFFSQFPNKDVIKLR